MTQQECANVFGVKLRAWQTYKQGISEPKYEMLCKIADYFNVTLDYLLGRELPASPTDTIEILSMEKMLMTINLCDFMMNCRTMLSRFSLILWRNFQKLQSSEIQNKDTLNVWVTSRTD